MTQVIRCALPGYDALTDTNLDHFSLFSDVDNVLIKRKQTGTGTIAIAGGSGYTVDTIPHNLGYVPFFMVYADILGGGVWYIINNQFNPFEPPPIIATADTENLYIINFDPQDIDYAYDIFYDDMDQAGTPEITESKEVIKVTRPGYDALTDKNPNHYIMHSDLNNFKILKQATVTLTGTNETITHGMTLNTPYKFFCFVKFPDGKTALAGLAQCWSYDNSKSVEVGIDSTNITVDKNGGSFTVDVTYIIYGSAVDGSVNNNGNIIAVAEDGHDVLTETNPDNFNFHSNYNTLKYFSSGQTDYFEADDNFTQTIPHNLGYVPFFIGFVNDLSGIVNTILSDSERKYAIMPFMYGRSSLAHPSQNIGGFIYADDTNIYLRAYFQTNAIGTGFFYQFYYKIFKNNLGL